MDKKYLVFAMMLFFLTACTQQQRLLTKSANPEVLPDEELYKFPTKFDDCDRFRPIFQKEMGKYPSLKDSDLTMIYSHFHRKCMCNTIDGDGVKEGIRQLNSTHLRMDFTSIYDKLLEHIRKIKKTSRKPTRAKEFYIGEIDFSNYSWFIKTSIGKTGPGPNYFYYDNNSVFLDEKGNLHLRILERDGKWYSSEVVLKEHLGYGKYTFYVKGDVSKLDKNAVLGLYTYDLDILNQSDYFHREIDFEMGKWGFDAVNNTQFALQGPLPLEAIKIFNVNYSGDLIVSFNWKESDVDFELRKDDANKSLIENWTYDGYLAPKPGKEDARMNLWVYNNTPSKEEETEVIIKRFEFEKQ